MGGVCPLCESIGEIPMPASVGVPKYPTTCIHLYSNASVLGGRAEGLNSLRLGSSSCFLRIIHRGEDEDL